MTTIVNTPPTTTKSGGNIALIIGIIFLIIVSYLFFMYGIPALKQIKSPQINVPSEIDINLNQQDK